MNLKNPEKIVKAATIGIIIYLLCFGVATAFFPIRPFWNDEWRLIYNLKFKTVHQLWGPLDLLQQCPRVYLTLLKKITSFFDYSYIAMRLPALLTAIASIFLLFHLKKKIVPGNSVYSYLFVLILISSQTFTDYLVQVKQYEIEIFVCLLALWQLVTLLDICAQGRPDNKYKYCLLCFSFAVAPFFSYTYPIEVAAVFPVIMLSAGVSLKNKQLKNGTIKLLLSLFLPLAIVCVCIIIFYFIDVRQLMADNKMYTYWAKRMLDEKRANNFAEDFWKLFSLLGSGLMFEIIFGIVGIASFLYGLYCLAKTKLRNFTTADYLKLFAVLLSILTLGLVFSGKLIGSVARLTAFTVPSISILIISFLEDIKTRYKYAKPANIIASILFIGLIGNILSTCINTFTYPEYGNRIKTYQNTSEALHLARLKKIPILITDGARGDKVEAVDTVPGNISFNALCPDQIAGTDLLSADIILKVNPEYKTWDTIPIYQIKDTKWGPEYMRQLPPEIRSAIVCDGINFKTLSR